MSTLPSLQALRILECAVRHESYTNAAIELGLTHGAISRQIGALEQWVGKRLFARTKNQMQPTEAARVLVTQTREALTILGDAFGHPVIKTSKQGLRITTTASIAHYWLMPRLAALHELHPDLILSLRTSNKLETSWADDADVALRYGPGRWPGVHSTRLGPESLFPVASPDFIATYPDWRTAPLIKTPYQNWLAWFKSVKVAPPKTVNRGIEVADAGMALEAALMGLGVALARNRLAKSMLQNGSLVRASAKECVDQYAYYIVCPSSKTSDPAVTNLREWLLDEFEHY